MELTNRKKEILREVVARFIENAEPVSSQTVVENSGFKLSSATIRREMAELEELGYLTHPYTSAGRVPSDKGYKFFVDNFVQGFSGIKITEKNDVSGIKLDLDRDMGIESILQESSLQLARMTSYLSLIMAPALNQSRFRHLELLKFHGNDILMVLITDTGRVFKKNFTVEGAYNNLDFQSISNILNSQLRDKNISDISFERIKISDQDAYLIPLIKNIMKMLKDCAREMVFHNRIFIHGASLVINQPDFIDIKKVHNILKIIENKYLLMDLLLKFSSSEDLIIKIGSEIFEEGPDDLSLVASKYRIYENSTGAVGVLGPKRMDYYKVIGIINAFAEKLRDIFSTNA
jgi:heat-inducible transcriptional repressor